MKIKIIIVTMLLMTISGCSINNKIGKLADLKQQKFVVTDEGGFYYSNEVINPFTGVVYFVGRNSGPEECLITNGKINNIPENCKKSSHDNADIKPCNQWGYKDSPTLCALMIKNEDGSFEKVRDLTYFEKENKNGHGDGEAVGAELIKFITPNKLLILFGFDYKDENSGTEFEIKEYNLSTERLETTLISSYKDPNEKFFEITKLINGQSKTLLFLNEPPWPYEPINEKGVYLISYFQEYENKKTIKKIPPPEKYNTQEKLLPSINLRDNYDASTNSINLLINDNAFKKNYIFDFVEEAFR